MDFPIAIPFVHAMGFELLRMQGGEAELSLQLRADQHNSMPPGRFSKQIRQRPRQRFRLGKLGMIFALARILPCKKLLQANDLCTTASRLGYPTHSLQDVLLAGRTTRRLHKPHSHDAVHRLGPIHLAAVSSFVGISNFAAGTGNCSASSAD